MVSGWDPIRDIQYIVQYTEPRDRGIYGLADVAILVVDGGVLQEVTSGMYPCLLTKRECPACRRASLIEQLQIHLGESASACTR